MAGQGLVEDHPEILVLVQPIEELPRLIWQLLELRVDICFYRDPGAMLFI